MEWLGLDQIDIDFDALLKTVREFVLPRLAQTALLLLFAGVLYIAARWLLNLVQRKLTSLTETQFDDILIRCLRSCALISIVFWALWRLGHIWEQPRIATLIVGVWIVVFSVPVARLLIDLLHVVEEKVLDSETRVDDTALPWLNRIVWVIVVGAAALVALEQLGINITPLIAGAGVAGLAISLAAKDTLSNLIAGILLIMDRPFVVGDRIELWRAPGDSASWGDVVEVGLRATKIRNTDNIVIIIPNNVIMARDIINYTSSGDSIRLRIPIGIAYDADAAVAKKLILEVAEATHGVKANPKPVVLTRSFGDSAVNLELRVWLENARRRRDVGDQITDKVKDSFDAHGIEIPFPKRDLYIRSAPEGFPGGDGSEPAPASEVGD